MPGISSGIITNVGASEMQRLERKTGAAWNRREEAKQRCEQSESHAERSRHDTEEGEFHEVPDLEQKGPSAVS
eukprot:2320625-Rhodomonas_salina.2